MPPILIVLLVAAVVAFGGIISYSSICLRRRRLNAIPAQQDIEMQVQQPEPVPRSPQTLTLQGDTTQYDARSVPNLTPNAYESTAADSIQWTNPLSVINEEQRYVSRYAPAASGAIPVPPRAHTRRSEMDARSEGLSPYRVNERGGTGDLGLSPYHGHEGGAVGSYGVGGVGTAYGGGPSDYGVGSAGMAYGGGGEASLSVAPAVTEAGTQGWTTVSTFATAANTQHGYAQGSEFNRPVTPMPTAQEFEHVNLDEDTEEDAKEDEKKGAKDNTDTDDTDEGDGRTEEERLRARREKALSEASAKLEGTWEGYVEQSEDGALDYARMFE